MPVLGAPTEWSMAVAISVPSVSETTKSQVQAATWTSISAGIALFATIPLVAMIVRPLADLMFVRGSAYDGDWGAAFTISLVMLAPATYTLFFVTTGELLKSRVSAQVHRMTLRVAAIGLVPYLVMIVTARVWSTGPQQPLMLAALLTIPVGIAATIWGSTQNHG